MVLGALLAVGGRLIGAVAPKLVQVLATVAPAAASAAKSFFGSTFGKLTAATVVGGAVAGTIPSRSTIGVGVSGAIGGFPAAATTLISSALQPKAPQTAINPYTGGPQVTPSYNAIQTEIMKAKEESMSTAREFIAPVTSELAGATPASAALTAVENVKKEGLLTPTNAAIAGAAAALGAGAAILGARIRKKKAKKKAVKRKARRKAPRKKKSRLKFGSPAWRKKYVTGKKRSKSRSRRSKSRSKGSGSYYEIEQKPEFGERVTSGPYKAERVGTQAQYKKSGGKEVKYTKKGQPYIILESGRARFIRQ